MSSTNCGNFDSVHSPPASFVTPACRGSLVICANCATGICSEDIALIEGSHRSPRPAISASIPEACPEPGELGDCRVLCRGSRCRRHRDFGGGQRRTKDASIASRARRAGAAIDRERARRPRGELVQNPSAADVSAKRCRRSQLIRSSPTVCGPRSISGGEQRDGLRRDRQHALRIVCVAHDAAPARFDDERIVFRRSSAACTSVSLAFKMGSRLVFWLQPAVSARSVSG